MFVTRMALPRRTFLRGIGATLAVPLCGEPRVAYCYVKSGAAKVFERMGGRLEQVYWTTGGYDLVAVASAPDDETLAAVLLSAIAWITEGVPHIVWTTRLVALMLYSGIVCTAFANWAMTMVNRSLPAVTTSLSHVQAQPRAASWFR